MALKFLNKKGWHTGSLRNVENVWKAEQKHEAEQKKLEELRKQIHEERERAEFRELQVQAGLIPKQERLDFLYESGLAVGKGNSSFKELESLPKTEPETAAASSSGKQPVVPGALFAEKPQSANDAWRKLHSDPLLMIRQREQEALARVKNNPVQMAMIRKSVQAEKAKDKDVKKQKSKHHKKSKHQRHSSPENESDYEDAKKQRGSHHHKSSKPSSSRNRAYPSDDEISEEEDVRRKKYHEKSDDHQKSKKSSHHDSRYKEYSSERHEKLGHFDSSSDKPPRHEQNNRHRKPVEISEEERAARLREMQTNAEIHEQQRWKRLKKAEDSEAREAVHDRASLGRNFLDAAHKSVYGADKGGSKSIEESVRRRMHYSQGRSDADSNAFRRS